MPEERAKKDKKAPPANLVIPPKKPKLTKAERRALQEQQRAAKAAGTDGKEKGGQQKGGQDKGGQQKGDQQKQQPQQQQQSSEGGESSGKAKQNQKMNKLEETKADDNTMDLFSHLPNYNGKCVEIKQKYCYRSCSCGYSYLRLHLMPQTQQSFPIRIQPS